MNSKKLYDKGGWIRGPWEDEPDLATWIDSETFYACVIFRNQYTGTFCGYVGLDWQHQLYQVEADAEEFQYIDVHGGVQFVDWAPHFDQYFYPAQRRWWIGFDCMQDGDFCPALQEGKRRPGRPRKKPKTENGETYRDFEYVQTQMDVLTAQIAMFDSRFF